MQAKHPLSGHRESLCLISAATLTAHINELNDANYSCKIKLKYHCIPCFKSISLIKYNMLNM